MEVKTATGFLNYWLENVIRGNIRQSTYMAYRGYIVNHIQKYIGEDKLTDLKTERLQSFITSLQAKRLAGKTIRSVMLMLRSALKCAVEYEYVLRNPCDKVRLPKPEEKEIIILDADARRRV